MMSKPHLPPEIVDFIIDFLSDDEDALKHSCLVSKSWALRTRRHLFKHIEFEHPKHFSTWRDFFPDPVNSPAIYTRSLSFRPAEWLTNADVGWRRSFINVSRLKISIGPGYSAGPGPRLGLQSLDVCPMGLPLSWVISDLICSFPLLQDLHVVGFGYSDDRDGSISQSLRSPPLTGTLVLGPTVPNIVHRLSKLPFRFRKIVQEWSYGEVNSVNDFVDGCSDTLEYLEIHCRTSSESISLCPRDKFGIRLISLQ
jgi:hypothetical protein